MAEKTPYHPALAVSNIKNLVPIVLEMENGQYSSWAELFKIHCRAYQVIDHIIPAQSSSADGKASTQATDSSSAAVSATDPALWSRLDAIVLQWIYGTISNDLLHTILMPDSTAQQAWERLQNIFQDNKHSRAVYLENQFSQVRQDNFPSITAYCQELKMLSDQLSNVGAPVSNQRLVLQLITGLNESYDGVATFIQQSDPLLPFYEARSRLILEETRKAKQAALAASSPTALAATPGPSDDSGSQKSQASHASDRSALKPNDRGNNGRGRGRGRGRGNNGRGRSCNFR